MWWRSFTTGGFCCFPQSTCGHWLICVYEVLGMYYHKPWPITIEKVLEIQKTNTYWYSRFISGIYKNDISGGFR